MRFSDPAVLDMMLKIVGCVLFIVVAGIKIVDLIDWIKGN